MPVEERKRISPPFDLSPNSLVFDTASDSAINYPQMVDPRGIGSTEFLQGLSQDALVRFVRDTRMVSQIPPLSPYGLERQPWVFTTFDSITGTTGARGRQTLTDVEVLNRLNTQLSQVNFNSNQAFNKEANRIFWSASPKSVSWQISQRAAEEKNKSGTVLHVWRDRERRTDYDDPKITIQFQTGNIHPLLAAGSRNTGTPSQGLNNFYQFLQLVDEPKISASGSGQPNLIHILYRSTIFPSMVITGFFDQQVVVQFTDDSQNPWQVNSWQATFTIYDTSPKINSFKDLQDRFSSEGLGIKVSRETDIPQPTGAFLDRLRQGDTLTS